MVNANTKTAPIVISAPEGPDEGDVLVVIHPGSASRGSARLLRAQWALIDAFDQQTLFILEGGPWTHTALANTYREVIDVAIDERECTGAVCAIAAGEDDGEPGLDAGIARLLDLARGAKRFVLTGAWADQCVAHVAETLRAAGHEALVHESAMPSDDSDPEDGILRALFTDRE